MTAAEDLTRALAEWRAARAPSVADRIDRLDEAAQADFAAPRARTREAFQAAWLAAAREVSPVVTGWLAANMTQLLPVEADHFGLIRPDYARRKYAALFARLEALRAHQPDPRIARALVEVVREAPFSAWVVAGNAAIYQPMLDAIAEAGDVRAIAPLRELVTAPRAKVAVVRQVLAEAIPATIAKLEAVGVAPRSDGDRGEAPAAIASAPVGDDLLARIYERPDDDEARLVYADFLQERGDPRGELIAIQCREARGEAGAKERSRAGSLLRQHKEAWLGPLARVLLGVEWERGFPSRAELAQNAVATPAVWEEAARDPRLATVRELGQGRGNLDHYRRFVTSEAMRNLAAIEIAMPRLLEELLADPRPRPFQHLVFRRAPRRKLLAALAAKTALGRVRSIRVPIQRGGFASLVEDLRASGMLARLTRLAIWPLVDAGETAAEVLAAFAALPATVERLAVECAGRAEIARTAGGLALSVDGWLVSDAHLLPPVLPDGVVRFTVDASAQPLRPEDRERIERAAGRRGLTAIFAP